MPTPPQPAASPAFTAPRLVGRDPQLQELAAALARPPAVVLVEGEPGIGKSRLVREFLAGPAGRAHRALVGNCPPHREQATLAPLVAALRSAGNRIAELSLSGLGGALRPLFPEWSERLPPPPEPLGDPEAARHRLYRALAELIARLRITVLVLEDVHWADPGSLEFLLFLATRQQARLEPAGRQRAAVGDQLSLVITYRPEEVPVGSPLLRLSSRLPYGVTQLRLALPPLDVAETGSLVSSMLGGAPVSHDFMAILHERTDGLPLAIEESVRLLGDRTELVRRSGDGVRSSLERLQVPPTVRDSTLELVRRQSPVAVRLLRAAAVVGVPADEATLATVADLPMPVAREAAAEALVVGLLREVTEGADRGRLAFRHALSSAALYESIPAPERRTLHLRAGEDLERQPRPPAAGLARHFREAGDAARWARWAERAADAAIASSDYLTATGLLADLPDQSALPMPTRVALAKKLASTALYLQVAEADRTDRVIRAVRGLLDQSGLDTRDEAELRNLLGRLLNQRGEPAAAFTEFVQSIPHLAHAPVEAARSMVSLGWPRAGSWPAEVHLRWLRRAERVPADRMSSVDRLSLQVDRATALLQLGAPAGWAVAAELPTTAADPAEWLHLARGRLNIGDAAMQWGRYGHARGLLTDGLAMAREHRFERLEGIILATLARLDWLTGDWQGLADRVAALAKPMGTELAGPEEAGLVAGLLAAARGAYDRAGRLLQASLDEAHRQGSVTLALAPAAALAWLRLSAGEVAAARSVTDGPIETLVGKKIWVWGTEIVPVRVAVLLRAGRVDEAEALVAAFGAGLRGRDAPAPRAALTTCRALLAGHRGGPGTAASRYAAAARAWEALPRPYPALLCREHRASSLLAAGRAETGLDELAAVRRGLRTLGAAADADRIAGILREHGVGMAQRWRGGRRGYGERLSPREWEVARLVATGKTNQQIAKLLSKTPGTVAEQLRSAMRKLGVSSRTALAVLAARGGLPEPGPAPDGEPVDEAPPDGDEPPAGEPVAGPPVVG
ncbi:MAG TPA: AAA family ATPase [Natronosporangium sp.]